MKNYAGLLAVALLFGLGFQAVAQDEEQILLQDSMAYAAGLEGFKAEFTLESVVERTGAEETLTGEIVLGGGEGMYFSFGDDKPLIKVYSSGAGSVLYNPVADRSWENSDTRIAMLKQMGNRTTNLVFVWLADYLSGDTRLINEIKSSEFVAQLEMDARPVLHAKFKYPNYNIDAWIAQDDPPTLMQFAMGFDNAPNQPKMTFTFAGITPNPELDGEVFAFNPGAETEVVNSPNALFGPKQNIRVGVKAPDFTLPKLGGGEVSLADHRGKDIVLLDFFASWCGPCRMAMPAIDELAREYADKNIVFYAVNLREGAKVAERFIGSADIKDMEVILDDDGKVSTDYEAFNIPRTVIVDKDGIIQSVHRGYSPQLKSQLKKELDAVLKAQGGV